ncbi:glucuronate isomerase [Pantoea cypripedii]|nr:glucuronate isomerase [Pantoea cypripedii]
MPPFRQWVKDGILPEDEQLLGNKVQDICFNNAQRFFALDPL